MFYEEQMTIYRILEKNARLIQMLSIKTKCYILAFYNLTYSIQVLYTVFYTFPNDGTCKENLYNNQELIEVAIIPFIFMTLMFDLRVILLGEFRCLSLTGRKWLGINDREGSKLKRCMEERAT